MSKSKKMLTWVLLVACFVVQTSMFASALSKGDFDVTMPNLWRNVTLFTGQNAGTGQHSYLTVDGGTVNCVYAQIQLKASNFAVSKGWREIPNDGHRYVIYFSEDQVIGEGTDLKMVAFQKNVASKTAKGHVFL